MEGKEGEFFVVRKPDGTYWEVAAEHLVPRSGGTYCVDLGEQVVEEKRLAQCRDFYTQLQAQSLRDTAGPGVNS
jgi:hypothetical protein